MKQKQPLILITFFGKTKNALGVDLFAACFDVACCFVNADIVYSPLSGEEADFVHNIVDLWKIQQQKKKERRELFNQRRRVREEEREERLRRVYNGALGTAPNDGEGRHDIRRRGGFQAFGSLFWL